MIIEYIDYKINNEIRIEKHDTEIGKWLLKLILIYNIFTLNINLPYFIKDQNITINKFIVTNSREIDDYYILNNIGY